jgi:hypothetical protein
VRVSDSNYKKVNELMDSLARLVNWGAVGFTFRIPFLEENTPLLVIESPEDRARKVVAISEIKQDISDLIENNGSVFFDYIHKEDIDSETLFALQTILTDDEYQILLGHLAIGE